jgi:NitT/TauT family transport system substrate-binding protein
MSFAFPGRRLTLLAAATASALVLAGCAAEAAPAASGDAAEVEVASITVGVTPIANAATVYLASDQGFFEEESLEVTPSIIQAAAAAIPSLLNDELQFALISAVPTITAASKGLPVEIALANDRYGEGDDYVDGAALVASAGGGVTDVSDLAGKTVAVVGLKSAPELATRLALEEIGVDADSIDFVEIAYPDMVSALQADRVAAAVVVDPFLSQAKASGLAILSQPFIDGLGGEVGTTWVTSTEFATAQADVAGRFQRAMTKAIEYAAANPDEVRRIMGTYTEMSEQALANAVLPVYDASITDENVQFVADVMYGEGFIDTAFDTEGLLWRP